MPFAAGVLLLLEVGCQSLEPQRYHAPVAENQAARNQREAQMNSEWRERRYAELLVKLGKPVMVLEIPGGGNPPGFVVLYGPHPGTGCVDSFALTWTDRLLVRDYFCR